ncbi:hypothetical protein AZI86_00430 [Bdellovibrio bacteriovorus]|uniref:ATPase dynein-related AAA domain-containing protein n=1 Tax=Bdellovibrio bacteriovorus TaxID=959 RepID=A0A150WM64_BDEBC|nr:AAA family ATPase [Bdellovibrio bacteriovorus]KYG65581.1 hypothetical protein AZI86_00430 [Bdellovibrio bacteriovorus]
MDHKKASEIFQLIKRHKNTPELAVEVIQEGRPLKGFHTWADDKPLMGAVKVTSGNQIFHILFIEWREDGNYYLVAYTGKKIGPLFEIHEVENGKLIWNYAPKKRDVWNSDRISKFSEKMGSDNVFFEIPKSTNELPKFLRQFGDLILTRDEVDSFDFGATPSRRYWVEKTITKDRPDRVVGPDAVGKALWSPQLSKDGRDIYSVMREVQPGDIVFHLTNNEAVTGISQVANVVDDTFEGIEGTEWQGEEAYRIPLKGFERLKPPISRGLILSKRFESILRMLLDKHKNLFFNKNLSLNQGAYLTEAPRELVNILNTLYQESTGSVLTPIPGGVKPNEIAPQERVENQMKKPLNQIFYGPPGTGKTFRTAYEAVEIIDGRLPQISDPKELHRAVMSRFEDLRELKKIGFVTFHSSYSYEEFMEGIFPSFGEDKSIQYELRDGVFKDFVDNMRNRSIAGRFEGVTESSEVWRLSLGSRTEPATFENAMRKGLAMLSFDHVDFSRNDINEYYDAHPDSAGRQQLTMFVEEMKINDIICVFNSQTSIRAIGIVTGDYEFRPDNPGYPHTRKVKWIDQQVHEVLHLNGGNKLMTPSVHRMKSAKVSDVLALVGKSPSKAVDEDKYVFIIDEINRANISKVFGELLTVIESSKREGEANCVKVQLPYSKQKFVVPKNLHIIGTMNTADRSIAMMDIALRRRFSFVELNPNYSLVPEQVDGLPIRQVLNNLNRSIAMFIGRDYRLGHSFLMKERISDLTDFKKVWFTEIMPMLSEYFHGDWNKLKEIVNDFVDESIWGEEDDGRSYDWIRMEDVSDEKFSELIRKLAS